MATMTALSTVTVGAGGAATISFSSIPQTYTDLVVKVCGRSTATGSVYDDLGIYFNSSTADLSWRILYGTGGSASTTSGSTRYFAFVSSASATASTFSNVEYYIPNYAGSNNKSVSADSVTENNGTTALTNIAAGLWSNTSAITTITLNPANGNFVEHSTATLYGVFKGPQTLPSTPTIGTATATGGTTATVAFTPTSATGVDASYTALSTPGSITATGTSSPVTVSGLTSGTAYTFQVRANNPGGSSAYSSASNSITPSNSYESIATVTVGSGGASDITFSSIPSTYTHLQIRGIGRTNRGNVEDGLYLRFNSTTTGYNDFHVYASNTSISAFSNTGSDTEIETYTMPGNNAASSIFGAAIIDIIDYADTNKYKTIKLLGGFDNNSTNSRVSFTSGLWRNTNAISSITLIAGNSTWLQYSSFALYGIKGA